MKKAKRSEPNHPDSVFLMAYLWSSYAAHLECLLDHYGPQGLHLEAIVALRQLAESLTPIHHLELLERALRTASGVQPPDPVALQRELERATSRRMTALLNGADMPIPRDARA